MSTNHSSDKLFNKSVISTDLTPYLPSSNIDYTNLEQALSQGMWGEANNLTKSILTQDIILPNQPDEQSLTLMGVQVVNIPWDTLIKIDCLWTKYSNGKFGFTSQYKIWQESGGKEGYSAQTHLYSQLGWNGAEKDDDVLQPNLISDLLLEYFPNLSDCFQASVNFNELKILLTGLTSTFLVTELLSLIRKILIIVFLTLTLRPIFKVNHRTFMLLFGVAYYFNNWTPNNQSWWDSLLFLIVFVYAIADWSSWANPAFLTLLARVKGIYDGLEAGSLGWLFFESKKNYSKSIRLLNNAINSASTSGKLYYHRGRSFLESGKIWRATKDFNLAIKYKFLNAEVYFYRGCAKAKLGLIDEAFSDFDTAISLDYTLIELVEKQKQQYNQNQ